MAWAKFDDGYNRHQKIVRAGRDARDFHTACIFHCSRELTDGLVEEEFFRQILADSMSDKPLPWILERCVQFRLLDVDEEGRYWVHDFLVYNPSRQEVVGRREEISRKRADAGRKGMASRWGHRGNPDNNDNERDNKPDNKTADLLYQKNNPESRIPNPESQNPDSPDSMRAAASRGTRLKEPFEAPEEWLEFAARERPEIDPAIEANKFADYWHSIAGAKARKSDWFAAWRWYVRSDLYGRGQRPSGSGARSGTCMQDRARHMDALLRERGLSTE